MLIFSWLIKPFLVIFLSNQDTCGHRMVRAPVVRGVVDSMEEFVLICPLGKPSGEISWILLQMFHCVSMLGIGVGPFDLNENAPQRFAVRASPSSAHRANQKVFPPPDFPRFPCRVYLLWSETWEYHGPSPWSIPLLAQPATIWHLQWKHSESVPAVADHQCLHTSLCKVHFHINSLVTDTGFKCNIVK